MMTINYMEDFKKNINLLSIFAAGIVMLLHSKFTFFPVIMVLVSIPFGGWQIFLKSENYAIFYFPLLYAILWPLIIFLFTRKIYIISSIISITLCVFAFSDLQEKQAKVDENISKTEQEKQERYVGNTFPPSGFLVPNASFATPGFKLVQSYYNSYSVLLRFESLDSPLQTIRYQSNNTEYKPSDIRPKPGQVYYFSHKGGEGEVIKLLGMDETSSDQMSYRLRWADGSDKTITITVENFEIMEPPYENLIGLLDKLERVP